VNLHELLEIEEGEVIILAHLKELAKGSICLDVTLVSRVLKILGLAVLVNALGDIGARD